ncbi:MAG: hypothetical protein ABF655_11435 [Liquorilactobacillus satsumensis]|uniref:hypothetical protein n=1 Tax=Liquorilactobacillus satsumensis TaxID=259059 RepID=UPI0039EA845B
MIFAEESENLQSSKRAYKQLSLHIKQLLRENKDIEANSLIPVLYLLVGIIAENSLMQSIRRDKVSDRVVDSVKTQRDIKSKWLKFVEESVKFHFDKEIDDLEPASKQKYEELISFINQELSDLITIRNRLVHGQFTIVFNSARNDISNILTNKIQSINFYDVEILYHMFIDVFYDMFWHVSVAPDAFTDQFDKKYQKYTEIKSRYSHEKFSSFSNDLKRRGRKVSIERSKRD